jgi:hypothetical protein
MNVTRPDFRRRQPLTPWRRKAVRRATRDFDDQSAAMLIELKCDEIEHLVACSSKMREGTGKSSGSQIR